MEPCYSAAPHGLATRAGAGPRLRRGPGEGLLHREGRVPPGPRPPGHRRAPIRPADASRFGLLHRPGNGARRHAARIRQGPPAGGPGHPRSARRAPGTRAGGRRGPGVPLGLVRLLQRPGRQRLVRPADPPSLTNPGESVEPARRTMSRDGHVNHSRSGGLSPSTEKSPRSRISPAAAAMALTAIHVRPPPTLTRCAPASAISKNDIPGRASTFTGFVTASQTTWISSLLRRPGAKSTSAPAASYARRRAIVSSRW